MSHEHIIQGKVDIEQTRNLLPSTRIAPCLDLVSIIYC